MDRNKLKLTFLLLLTALPITLATIVFYNREGQGFGATTNKGNLIIPVLDVTALAMRDAQGDVLYRPFEEEVAGVAVDEYEPRPWLLVYLGDGNCDAACDERLYFLRQLHARLGADALRVNRIYLAAGESPGVLPAAARDLFTDQYPAMRLAWADDASLRSGLAPSHEQNRDPVGQHFIYVVDPVGNVMLYFTPENSPEEILSDLETLLDQTSLG